MATSVNISSYSGSVVAGDWSPAVTAAVAAIAATGGTIVIDTAITLKSQISITPSSNYYSLNIVGDVGAAITINAAASDIIFYLGNLNLVRFANLTFLGKQTTPGTTADCRMGIYTGFVEKCLIENCLFAGVRSAEGMCYAAAASDMVIRNCKFGGGGLAIVCDGANSLTVEDTACLDYQNYLGSYYSRANYGQQWIKAFNPPNSENTNVGFIAIRRFRGDEGTNYQINIADYPRVIIEQCSGNVYGVTGGKGIILDGVAHAIINEYWCGYNGNSITGISLTDCGYVTVDGYQTHNGDHPVSVSNSRAVITAAAPASEVLTVPIASGTLQRLTITDSPDVTTTCDPGYGAITTFQNVTEVVPTR